MFFDNGRYIFELQAALAAAGLAGLNQLNYAADIVSMKGGIIRSMTHAVVLAVQRGIVSHLQT